MNLVSGSRLRCAFGLALFCSASLSCANDTSAGGGSTAGSGTGSDTTGGSDDGVDETTVAEVTPDDGPDDVGDTGGTTNPPPVCGNGTVEGVEACDDGNDVNGDGCDNDCTETFDSSLWQTTQGGDAALREAGQGVAVGPDDEIVVVGYIVDELANPDIFVRKVDGDGNELWTVRDDVSMGGEDRAYAVAIDGAGNIAVTGETDTSPASADIWISMLDPDGVTVWSVTVDGPAAGNDGGRAIAFDNDGNLGLAGLVRAGANDNDIWVAVYDSLGVEVWSDTVAGPQGLDDRGRGVVFDDDGALYVSGFIDNGAFNRDVWLRKYDAAGSEDWTVTWDSDDSADDAGFSISRSANGNLVVAGISPVLANNQDFWVGTFEPEAGELQWWKRFGGPAIVNDNAFGVATDSMDNVIVVGFKGFTDTDTDIWMRKFDVTGLELWSQTIFGAGMDNDEARAVAVDASDNIIVTGEIRDSRNNDGDIWLAKFAPE